MTDRFDRAKDPDASGPPEAEAELDAELRQHRLDAEIASDVADEDLETDALDQEAVETEEEAAVAAAAGIESAPTGDVEPAAVGPAASEAARARRRGSPAPGPQRAPTASELAVRIREDVSKVFVIGTAVIFAAILLNGLVLGHGGLVTATPSPSVAPSSSAGGSASPGASSSPAASGSVGPSTAPSAAASAAPSAVPSAVSSAIPSVSPS
jgi:hypothetical protein